VVLLILAGCGQEGKPTVPAAQTVAGRGFTFQAPVDWTVERRGGVTSASSGPVDLVQVTVYPVARRYDPALFPELRRELDGVAAGVAKQLSGRVVSHRVARAAGQQAHAYVLEFGDRTEELTFVFRGRREYLLLCRRLTSAPGDACALLVESFAFR
jgi:hypothetical protein